MRGILGIGSDYTVAYWCWIAKIGGSAQLFSACAIERRPRGASRAALAPTFISGQLSL